MQISAPYRETVRSVVLDVLVPAAESFTCDDIALQEVGPAEIAVSRVKTATASVGGSAPISDIPREGTKLLLATGLGPDDQPLVRGCATLGTVDDDVVVDIEAEPVTILTADKPALGAPLKPNVEVTLTDVAGRAQAGAAIEWRVVGPAGTGDDGIVTTDAGGKATVPVGVGTVPGPRALVPVARWMIDPPEPVIGFTAPEPVVLDIPIAPVGLARGAPRHLVGHVGPAGEIGFALLSEPSSTGAGRAVVIAYRDGDEFVSVESPPVVGLSALGLMQRAGREEVFGIVADRWLEFRPDGTVGVTVLSTSGVTAVQIAAAGPCPDAPDEGIALVRTVDRYLALDADRNAVDDDPIASLADATRSIIGAGCATTTVGALRRAVVFGKQGSAPQVIADVGDVLDADWPTAASSIGFSRALPGLAAPLLGVEFDAAGVSIVRYELLASAGELQLQEIDADDAITLPSGPAAGDVDGDQFLDVVAVLPISESDEGVIVRIMVSLAVTLDNSGTRLVGVSGEFNLTGTPKLSLVDIDDDGDDDVVLVGDDRILVIEMGESR